MGLSTDHIQQSVPKAKKQTMAKEKEEKEESQARQDFRHLIEVYKAQNPVKYEMKKEELERKLAAIA
jgi:hypothetical protein